MAKAAFQCKACGYRTGYGNAATIALHMTVSHSDRAAIVGDGHRHKGYELRCTPIGWIIPALSSRTYESAQSAMGAIDAAGLDARV